MTLRVERRPIAFLVAATALSLLVLPFITTFDDLLTALAMHLGLDRAVQSIVPLEARAVAGLLGLVQVPAAAYGSQIILKTRSYSQPLLISWNCTGWQSLLLLGGSLLIGLRGDVWSGSRLPVVAIGLIGTLLLNLVRIATVCLVAASAGYVPAILFHDYGGTLSVAIWLLVFWTVVQRWRTDFP
jgi:exosortase/archaeosortase family protein